MTRPKAIVSWSSGKDSAFALHACREAFDVVGVLTTLSEDHERVAVHGVREALLDRQVAALGLQAYKVRLPGNCTNAVYETRVEEALAGLRAAGVRHVVFGDLFLQDIRAYRVRLLGAAGMEPVFPLWGRKTRVLAREMLASGLLAHVSCLDPRRLDRSFAGRQFDADFLRDLPDDVDPCGENGEFHTVAIAGPMFAHRIPVEVGETVERGGFVFTDFMPTSEAIRPLQDTGVVDR